MSPRGRKRDEQVKTHILRRASTMAVKERESWSVAILRRYTINS